MNKMVTGKMIPNIRTFTVKGIGTPKDSAGIVNQYFREQLAEEDNALARRGTPEYRLRTIRMPYGPTKKPLNPLFAIMDNALVINPEVTKQIEQAKLERATTHRGKDLFDVMDAALKRQRNSKK